jgi:hypothetical protein
MGFTVELLQGRGAGTIPQTNATRQENRGKSITIFVILAPVTHLDDEPFFHARPLRSPTTSRNWALG